MGDAKIKAQELLSKVYKKANEAGILMTTLGIIIILLIALLGWIFHKIGLKEESCKKLDITYTRLTNESYFNGNNSIKSSGQAIFDNSNSTLVNYHVKSAYNSCCGDEYKNNFVALCALEKCIGNGYRFLDFEIYSYNNEPIVASSTANNNFIKETYNALLLSEVLNVIIENAFDAVKTICANDPLILNFRVMSTNLTMLEKMGDLFEEYLVSKSNNSYYSLLTPDKEADVLTMKMVALYKKIIIICDFNPDKNILINPKLTKLQKYVNLINKGPFCNTFRYKDIVLMSDNPQTIEDTKKKFTIVLPDLDNSKTNFDSLNSFLKGCQAICMKHQNLDSNLLGYNGQFEINGIFSWKMKPLTLINVAPSSITYETGTNLGIVTAPTTTTQTTTT